MDQQELVTLITRRVMDTLKIQELDEKAANMYGPSQFGPDGKRLIPLAISARHLHISQEDLEILFGKGYQITIRNALYQKFQYAYEEFLTVIGPNKRKFDKVRILGPPRGKTQVEISRTDAIFLGVEPPVAVSVGHKGGVNLTLVGPKATIERPCGICASRHIHMSPEDAVHFGIENEQTVKIHVNSEKPTLFENVFCRVNKDFRLEMHLDTDDGNAALVKTGMHVALVK
jgi:propanediol utilization protein